MAFKPSLTNCALRFNADQMAYFSASWVSYDGSPGAGPRHPVPHRRYLPPGETKEDEFFGRVQIYRGDIDVLVPLRRSYTTQDVAAGAQQTTRLAIDFMVNDIRLAGLDPIGEANAGIEDASALLLQFTIDRAPQGGEANGEIDEGSFERLTYAWDAPNQRLRLTYDDGTASSDTETLVDNVSNLRFTYLDENDAVTTDMAEIRSVAITMTVDEPAGRDGIVSRTYNTRVRCRNLGI